MFVSVCILICLHVTFDTEVAKRFETWGGGLRGEGLGVMSKSVPKIFG